MSSSDDTPTATAKSRSEAAATSENPTDSERPDSEDSGARNGNETSPRRRGSLVDMLSGGIWQMLAALTNFLYFPVLARVVDNHSLGAWSMLMNYALLLGLCDLGLSVAVQRVAVTGDRPMTRNALGFALGCVLLLAPIGCALIYFGVSELRPEWAGIADSVRETAPFAMASGIILAYALPFRGFVYTQGGVKLAALGKASGAILQTLILATGFFLPVSLRLVGIAAVCAALVDLVICMRAARRYDPQIPLFPKFPGSDQPRLRWLYDGMGAIVVNIFDVLASRVDVLILSERTSSPPALIAIYNYAGRVVEQPYMLTKQVLPSLTPRLGNVSERSEAVRTGTVVFTTLIFVGMSALALNGRELLVLVFGERLFAMEGGLPILELVVLLLGVAYVLMSTYEVSSPMLTLGASSSWIAAIPLFVGGATKYVISFFGAPQYGIWATAGGSIIAYTIASVWTWIAARKILGWSWKRVFGVFWLPLIAGGTATAVAFALRGFSRINWMTSTASCAITCGVGLAILVVALRRKTRRAQARESANV